MNGPDRGTLTSTMHKAINKAVAWVTTHGLTFGVAKTVAVLFHRKNTTPTWPPLKKYLAKYLGVILDQRLTFKEHVTSQCKKGIYYYLALTSSIGQL